jgi:hypothetical protein
LMAKTKKSRGVRAGLTRMERKAKVAKLRKPRTRLLKDGSVKESIIQADILKWLQSTGLLCWRSNSGSLFLHGRHINLGPVGCADISVIVPPCGRFVGLEVKSANGKVRKDQITYAAGLTNQGGLYFIVRSLTDAKNAIAAALGEVQWKSLFASRTE